MAKNSSVMPALAALKRGLRQTVMSSIGLGVVRSQTAKPASTIAAAANIPRINGSVQPRSGAWMIAYTSATRPTIDKSAPNGSSLGFDGSREVGMRITPAMSAVATIGRFTMKIEPQ